MNAPSTTPSDSPAPSIFDRLFSWQMLTASVSAGAVLLHMIGSVKHQKYLAHWQLDAELFPKSVDQILISGAYGVAERAMAIIKAVSHYWPAVSIGFFALVFYVFLIMTPLFEDGKTRDRIRSWRPWKRRLLLASLWVFVCGLFSWLGLIALVFAIAIPGIAGETAGTANAEEVAMDIAKGCNASKRKCVELLDDGTRVAHGYLLDSSPEHIAIFDVALQRARALPREGLELRGAAVASASAASSP